MNLSAGTWAAFVSASCTAAVFRMLMCVGGCRRGPYPELPAGEIEGGAPESRGEKLSHLLPDSGGRRRRLAAPAGPGERPSEVQLPHPSMTVFEPKWQLLSGRLQTLQTGADFITRLSAVFQGQCAIVPSINDRNDWKTVKNALQIMNIDEINTKVCDLHVFL